MRDNRGIFPRTGSSPHTRGALAEGVPVAHFPGIIPAYAGSTCHRSERLSSRPDHPRIRGEHIIGSIRMVIGWGSSPHTRGARPLPRPARLGRGIIPAYAGSTGSNQTRPLERPDHPRIRGEHARRRRLSKKGVGSSPHTRGARCAGSLANSDGRIIPAYAGSTAWRRRCR